MKRNAYGFRRFDHFKAKILLNIRYKEIGTHLAKGFLYSIIGLKEIRWLERKAATPTGIAWAEDPGLSAAREAAEAMPVERVRL